MRALIVVTIATIFIIIVCGITLLYSYEIKFAKDDPCYDIVAMHRRKMNDGCGIKFKPFEICVFAETVHGGCAEKRIFPKKE